LTVFSFDTQAVKRAFRALLKEQGDDKYCKVFCFAINKFLKAYKSWPVSGKQRHGGEDSGDDSCDGGSASKRARHSTGSQADRLDGGFTHQKLVIPDDDEMMSEDF
jgi:hypothetical protein